MGGRLKRLRTVEGLPDPVASRERRVDVGRKQGERRYAEHVVRPGDEVTVVGTANHEGGSGDGTVTVRPPGRAPFVDMDFPLDVTLYPPTGGESLVSEGSPGDAAAHVRNRTLLVPWAVALGGLGAAMVLGPSAVPGAGAAESLLGAAGLLVVGGVATWLA